MTKKEEKAKNKGESSKIVLEFIEKIVVNAGLGKMRNARQSFDEKVLPKIEKDLSMITGQKSQFCPAKKSVAGFSIRESDIVGLKTTLRGKKMEDFFNKINNVVLPRLKDFRGIELKNVDGAGNLNLGFREQYAFPEINADESDIIFGFQVTVVPYKKDRKEAIDFYRSVGVPLKKS